MAGKKKFEIDQEATFRAIIGRSEEENKQENTSHGESIEQEQPKESNAIITATDKKEARSKRVNLLVTPSVYAAAKKKCKRLDISLNECVNQFLEKWSKEAE